VTTSESQETRPSPDSVGRESLSELLARILDQLSVSAWLPAGALVLIALLYGSLAAHGDNPGEAIKAIASMTLPLGILLIGAVVLLTMATQAFEFEAIRLLEGYWGIGPIGRRVADVGCRFHIWRRGRLERRRVDLEDNCFAYARQRMLRNDFPEWYVEVVEAERLGNEPPPLPDLGVSAMDVEGAKNFDWQQLAQPADIRRLIDLANRVNEYPTMSYRVLPTRLGNVLRAREEKVYDPASGSMEGMVLRVYDQLPASLRNEHDRYRGRLDLYCSMVVVFVLGALASPVLFLNSSLHFNGDWRLLLVALGVGVSLALLSYRAAIASATGYGTVLEEIEALRVRGVIGDG
jgi:hypothetical protein